MDDYKKFKLEKFEKDLRKYLEDEAKFFIIYELEEVPLNLWEKIKAYFTTNMNYMCCGRAYEGNSKSVIFYRSTGWIVCPKCYQKNKDAIKDFERQLADKHDKFIEEFKNEN